MEAKVIDGCISCGACIATCPEVFRFDEDGLAEAYAKVTPEHEIVWEYINPYFNTILGQFTNNMVYRAYRVPYEWIPQVEKPEEISVEPIDVETFRVPGSLVGNGLGKVTTIDGVDPNARLMTGGGASEDEDEEVNFCVATVKKSDLIHK